MRIPLIPGNYRDSLGVPLGCVGSGRQVRDQGVAGSNPVSPTQKPSDSLAKATSPGASSLDPLPAARLLNGLVARGAGRGSVVLLAGALDGSRASSSSLPPQVCRRLPAAGSTHPRAAAGVAGAGRLRASTGNRGAPVTLASRWFVWTNRGERGSVAGLTPIAADPPRKRINSRTGAGRPSRST